MADWKDKYREGSFRGVPFKMESHTVEGGRRKQDREYAKRDIGNSEDLGKKLKKFRLELLVIGDDYFAQRDALEAALDAEGVGELRHPYRGTLQVQAGAHTLAETKTEGRMARFSCEFTEAGQIKFPDQVEDALTQATNSALVVKENSKSFFENVFSVANQPAFVVGAAEDTLSSVLDFADNAVKKVTEPVTEFSFAISNMKATVADLVRAPGELADRLDSAFNLLISQFENDPETSERIFNGFSTLDQDNAFIPVVGDTPSRDKQQINQDGLLNLTNQLALSNQAQSAVEVDFTSTDAALKSRNTVVDGFEAQLFLVNDDDLFQAIKDLQAALIRAVPRTGTSELITIVPAKTIPAIVIAYSQFEDLEKEDEIVEQNAIEHPGFVPGGDPIQVSAG